MCQFRGFEFERRARWIAIKTTKLRFCLDITMIRVQNIMLLQALTEKIRSGRSTEFLQRINEFKRP